MDVRFRRLTTARELRESSIPDRAKVMQQMQQPRVIKTLQVVYYLSRNGHLEHPHYMEITHFANHPLRLRDVMDRLTALRGKGMPSLYSWSCKRSYKKGYVWNDLAENDIIYPAEGAEYVLKGSELVEGCSAAERLDQLQISSSQQTMQQQESNFGSKRRSPLAPTRNREHDHHHHREADKYQEENQDQDSEDEQEEQELVDYEDEKTSYTSSTTPHSRCSRGVSTDELEDPPQTRKSPTVSTHPESSPPPPPTPNPSFNNIASNQPNQRTNLSTRFEDCDPVAVSDSKSSAAQSRNSILFQLIACGSSAVAKAKNAPCVSVKQHTTATDHVKKSSESFRKEIVYRAAVKVAVAEEDMIKCMSENPRFGNLQAEEKEYFSGSIVDSMKDQDRVLVEPVPGLKRSNSYNEERRTKAGIAAETVEEEKREKAAVKGKCVPRKLSSSTASKQRKK